MSELFINIIKAFVVAFPNSTHFSGILFAALAFATAVAVGVSAVFNWFEKIINDHAREGIRQFLARPKVSNYVAGWTAALSQAVDVLFDTSPLSGRFLVRSSFVSLGAVVLVAILFTKGDTNVLRLPHDPYQVKMAAILPFLSNLIPAYISLLVSRWLLRRMNRHRTGGIAILRLLILGSVFTLILALVFIGGAWSVTESSSALHTIAINMERGQGFEWIQAPPSYLTHLPSGVKFGLDFRWSFFWHVFSVFMLQAVWKTDSVVQVLFLAQFFPAVFVWLYAIAAFTLKLAVKMDFGLRFVGNYLDLKQPLNSIGKVAGLIAGLATFCLVLTVRLSGL